MPALAPGQLEAFGLTDGDEALAIAYLVNPLHYGTPDGLWTKAIGFLFGPLSTGGSVTGCLIWNIRTVKERR